MRHLTRHVHASVQKQIEDHLVGLGWMDPSSTPIGAKVVAFQRVRPTESLLQSVTPNLVTVSFGPQDDDVEGQVGGGLYFTQQVFFVDVLAEDDSVAVALCDDVRDLLQGRHTGTRYFDVLDFVQDPPTPVPGYALEYQDVDCEPATRDVQGASWWVVSGTVEVTKP